MNACTSSSPNRGSVLIVALLLALIIAIALTSYVSMATSALNLSQRSFLANEAMNVTETGLEQALWAFNQKAADNPDAWTRFNAPSGSDITGTFTGFKLAQNATAAVKVYVKHYDSTGLPAPVVVAEGTVTPANGTPIVKMVEVHLKRRSLFDKPFVTKEGIVFKGGVASVDSWNSDPDNDPSTFLDYSPDVRQANGGVATLSISATVDLQNANIYGYVSVGSDSVSAIDLGPTGVIGDFSTPLGTMDDTRIATNFTVDLPEVTVPDVDVTDLNTTYEGSVIQGTVSLPLPGDIKADDGKYYYVAAAIDQKGNSSNMLSITKALAPDGSEVKADVVIILTAGSGTTAFNTGGSGGGVTIASGASLAIYTEGDISLSGSGVANANGDPSTFAVYGTNTTPGAQTIDLVGNGDLRGVVYAPNADITIRGNGAIYGSVVGNTATVVGNAAFHYDEALAKKGDKTFRISKWREFVSATERAQYATQLNF